METASLHQALFVIKQRNARFSQCLVNLLIFVDKMRTRAVSLVFSSVSKVTENAQLKSSIGHWIHKIQKVCVFFFKAFPGIFRGHTYHKLFTYNSKF